MEAGHGLRPGQFLWRGEARPGAPARIVVDLGTHRAYVFRGGALIGISTVSTGRRGHATPAGSFPILEKAAWHRSNLYSNAPMPFMQRLTWGGIALHAGRFSGNNQSHGCIRLPWGFARLLFAVTAPGSEVDIVRTFGKGGPTPIEHVALPSTEEAVTQMLTLAI